jgi:hypothetical protein
MGSQTDPGYDNTRDEYESLCGMLGEAEVWTDFNYLFHFNQLIP